MLNTKSIMSVYKKGKSRGNRNFDPVEKQLNRIFEKYSYHINKLIII